MLAKEASKQAAVDSAPDPSQRPAGVITPSGANEESAAPSSTQLCNHTDEMLESVDSCVGCVNQIALQQDFEDGLAHIELPVHKLVEPNTISKSALSERETALIRLQVAEKFAQQEQQQKIPTVPLPDMDLLNIYAGSDTDDRPLTTLNQTTTTTRNIEATGALLEESPRCCSPYLVAVGEGHEQTKRCAICDDAVSHIADLPCCKAADICVDCIQLLTYPVTEQQRVGHCPCCRTWISTKSDLDITVVSPVKEQTCSICNQVKDYMLVQDNNDETVACDACFLGRIHPLEYECKACHVRQCIPHPMYRYQNSPDEFGQVTWACGNEKNKFSHWRICSDQIALIPVGDAPWGLPMDTARQFIQQMRRQQFVREHAQQMQHAQNCIIL